MNKVDNYRALNRLLTVLGRSLPSYLVYAAPWTHRGDAPALNILKQVADDQQQLSNRLAEHILDQYGPVEMGEYPLDFPDTHDLALDYLVGKMARCQKVDVARLEQIVPTIKGDPAAAALAEETLGAARGHLESFEELAAEAAKHGISWAKP